MITLQLSAKRHIAFPATFILASIIGLIYLLYSSWGSLQKIIYWCQSFAIVNLQKNPLITIFIILLFLLLIIGSFRALLIIKREIRSARQMRLWLQTRRDIAAEKIFLKIYGEKIWIVKNDQPLALTFGFFKPRIVLSKALLKLLNKSETYAVLLHELQHQNRKDPLRRFNMRILEKFLFFLPVFTELADSCAKNQEFSADFHSIQTQKIHINQLKSAVQKLLSFQLTEPDYSRCSFMSNHARLSWLCEETGGGWQFQFSYRNITLSILSVLILLILSLPMTKSFTPYANASTQQDYCQIASEASTNTYQQDIMSNAGLIKVNYSPL